MPTLLSIPREIRDKILEEALSLPSQEAPRDDEIEDLLTSRVELREKHRPKPKIMKSWTCGTSVKYPKATPCSIHPILLVNKQINAEAKEILSRMPAHFVLDVVLYKEIYLIPTWLIMPYPQHSVPHRIDSITCNFQIICSFDGFPPGVHYSGFRGGDGGGPAMQWVLYSLLERFFYFGPFWRNVENEIKDHYVCEELMIDVQMPSNIAPERFISPPVSSGLPRSGNKASKEIPSPMLAPRYLFGFIKGNIGSLLCMEYHGAEYGDILFTHLGRIDVTLDGQGTRSWDLASLLESLNPEYSVATTSQRERREGFLDWRPRAMAARKKCGLQFVDVERWDGSDLEYASYGNCMYKARQSMQPT